MKKMEVEVGMMMNLEVDVYVAVLLDVKVEM